MTAHPGQQRFTDQAATLEGTVERITYQNSDNGYTVLKLKSRRGAEMTVVGRLDGIQVGEALRLDGYWGTHPQHGRQFEATNFQSMLPATIEGIRKYLGSGLIRGVGPVTARRIVDHFGPDALDVIDGQPDRLAEVRGLGPKRARAIVLAWEEQRAIKDVMIMLQSLGVHTGQAVRIYREYGDDATQVIQSDPYRLARDIWGIGFRTADALGEALGIPRDSPERIAAGVRHQLSQAADNDGHLYLPYDELVASTAELLGCTAGQVERVMPDLLAERDIFSDDLDGVQAIYRADLGGSEIASARRVVRLIMADEDRLADFQTVDWERAFGWLSRERGVPELAEGQVHAVQTALTERAAVLTGGPGTGKSTTVNSIVALAGARRHSVILAAPTGRAAKRLTEITGKEAKTIHRLLKLQPGGDAAFNETNPLDTDLIVVDEASMLDIFLFNTLLKAIRPGTHLLLVGDVDQLPSVGPGNVLGDVIESGVVPTIRLSVVFRQAEQSAIIRNAHRINQGETPEWGRHIRDFAFARLPEGDDTPERAADMIRDLVCRRLPDAYDLSPDEIQVLCPMNGGAAGTRRLNETLQEELNPQSPDLPEMRSAGRTIRTGDRLIAMRNNYQLEVFNGDLAVVESIDTVDQLLDLRLDDGRAVTIPFHQADEFSHAFAISVHRSQGSEFRAVVIPVLTAHYMLLQRNLLYTAVTRAKDLVVLVGQRRALAIALKNDRSGHRYTAMSTRLQSFYEEAIHA